MTDCIELVMSPFDPKFAKVQELVMMVGNEYSDTAVDIDFDPTFLNQVRNATAGGVTVRMAAVTTHGPNSVTHRFDLTENSSFEVDRQGKRYRVHLVDIRQKVTGGDSFMAYRFTVDVD